MLNGVTTLLGDVNEVQNTAMEVCKSRDGLHLNDIALLQRMIKDTRGVDHLPPAVTIIVIR